jgi:transcriptional regulator with XRE-family HTH domain
MVIGQRIKMARKNQGLTQKELAERAGTAIGTIQQYELGKRQPRMDQLQKIAAALGVSISDLIGYSDLKLKKENASESDYTESEAEIKERVDALTKTFESCGYIAPGGDLTDEQLRFCMALVDFLDKYFGG